MPALQARSLPKGTLVSISEEWVSRLRDAKYQFVASHLYCGRAVTESLEAGRAIGAEVTFVSAGLGIVEQYQRIPAYSLTASSGYPDSVCNRVTGGYGASAWWRALGDAQRIERPLATFVEGRGAQLTVIAVPTGYLKMVADDIAGLPPKWLQTLRIIGPRRREEVDQRLRTNWMPYDGRLDNPHSGVNGTSADFPHRALRHFVRLVLANEKGGTSESHAAAVETALSRFTVYMRPRGQSASDEAVTLAIERLWKKHCGRRSSILRELRSDLNIACEQSRFRKLADRVEAKLNAPR